MCAIADLYEHEQPFIFAYCLKRIGNWHVAEDLTSAAFERALPMLPHDNPHALLLNLARYQVLNYWRRERKRATLVFSDAFTAYDLDQYHELAIPDDPIERVIEACDTAMAAAFVRATLSTCADQELRIIELRYVQRLSAKDCAAAMGLTMQQYNKRHNGLLHRLAQRLDVAPSDKPQPTCLVCDSPIYGRGVCRYHYQQARDGRPIPLLPPKVQTKPTECQECGAPHFSRGFCRKHYYEQRTIERMQERRAIGALL